MLRDPILDREMDGILEAGDDLCWLGEQHRLLYGEVAADLAHCLADLRHDLGMLLARYEDGPGRRYASPATLVEMRRIEARVGALTAHGD